MDQPTILTGRTMPPSAATLGWELISFDAEAQTIRVGFLGKPEFLNPAGMVQGGFLAAMLDDTMGPLVYAAHNGTKFGSTTDLHVTYLRPVKAGRIEAAGRVVKAGRSMTFLEGELFDAEGRLCARATASFFVSERG